MRFRVCLHAYVLARFLPVKIHIIIIFKLLYLCYSRTTTDYY